MEANSVENLQVFEAAFKKIEEEKLNCCPQFDNWCTHRRVRVFLKKSQVFLKHYKELHPKKTLKTREEERDPEQLACMIWDDFAVILPIIHEDPEIPYSVAWMLKEILQREYQVKYLSGVSEGRDPYFQKVWGEAESLQMEGARNMDGEILEPENSKAPSPMRLRSGKQVDHQKKAPDPVEQQPMIDADQRACSALSSGAAPTEPILLSCESSEDEDIVYPISVSVNEGNTPREEGFPVADESVLQAERVNGSMGSSVSDINNSSLISSKASNGHFDFDLNKANFSNNSNKNISENCDGQNRSFCSINSGDSRYFSCLQSRETSYSPPKGRYSLQASPQPGFKNRTSSPLPEAKVGPGPMPPDFMAYSPLGRQLPCNTQLVLQLKLMMVMILTMVWAHIHMWVMESHTQY